MKRNSTKRRKTKQRPPWKAAGLWHSPGTATPSPCRGPSCSSRLPSAESQWLRWKAFHTSAWAPLHSLPPAGKQRKKTTAITDLFWKTQNILHKGEPEIVYSNIVNNYNNSKRLRPSCFLLPRASTNYHTSRFKGGKRKYDESWLCFHRLIS